MDIKIATALMASFEEGTCSTPLPKSMPARFVVAKSFAIRCDPICRDSRDLFGPRRRIFLHVLFQLVISVAPLLHEGLIDEVLIDHHMEHGQGEGRIRPGPDRHPFVASPTSGSTEGFIAISFAPRAFALT